MHITTTTLLSLLGTSLRRQQPQGPQNGKAIYVLTNEDDNAVAAISIQQDGTLGDACLTSTGGAGAVAVDADGKEATPDALISQSSLTVAGQNIFAVNAGSNTVSMLAISPDDPLSLQMVGKPAALPGTFPNTVAASTKHNMVCVGMTGSQAGVACARFSVQTGIGAMDDLRVFDIKQSDPPVGPTNTVSQTFFSEDESMLFTTVKGDPAANNTGFLSVYPVTSDGAQNLQQRHRGRPACAAQGQASSLSRTETRSSPNGTAVLFGSAVIPGSNPPAIFATDASFGAGVLTLGADMKAQLTAAGKLADQKATCWTTIAPGGKSAYVTDVGINRIVEMSLPDASIVKMIDLSKVQESSVDPGLIDLRAAGSMVYALSPGNGSSQAAVSVVDAGKGELVQHALLGEVGVKNRAMGMAILM
ncbi:hypothetical protein EJ04DRAFT_545820 [Polyplosphaeria fusca]|uniref:3-carboxymuconate cyclase n=1 Tax=Polyplosphaeria fusca TaxID=682080 RepID=A0A9P4UYU7_9PLEO|nr:hypothetical protein EJ04DRAFT_545820 [Polyplosphaeria fusca]